MYRNFTKKFTQVLPKFNQNFSEKTYRNVTEKLTKILPKKLTKILPKTIYQNFT